MYLLLEKYVLWFETNTVSSSMIGSEKEIGKLTSKISPSVKKFLLCNEKWHQHSTISFIEEIYSMAKNKYFRGGGVVYMVKALLMCLKV